MLPKLRASDSDASKKGACTSRCPAHSVGGFEEVPATKSKALLSATEKAFSLCMEAAIFIRAERPGGCRRGSRARFGPARRRRSPAELRPLRTIPAQCAQHSRRSRLRSHRAALHTTRHRSEGSVGVLPLDTCKSMRITESRMSSGRTCATARPTHNASDSGRHSCSHRVARTSSGLTPSQSKRSGTSANCRPPAPIPPPPQFPPSSHTHATRARFPPAVSAGSWAASDAAVALLRPPGPPSTGIQLVRRSILHPLRPCLIRPSHFFPPRDRKRCGIPSPCAIIVYVACVCGYACQ